MTEPEWRPVPGYEGLYEVSDHGQVRGIARKGTHGGLLSPAPHRSGHLTVHLYRGGSDRPRGVHQLVAEAFLPPRTAGQEIRHLDGNPANNRQGNLVWGSRGENLLDAVRHGTHVQAKKTHCPAGHSYAGDNLYVAPDGGRFCRACQRLHGREKQRRRRARLRAGRGESGD